MTAQTIDNREESRAQREARASLDSHFDKIGKIMEKDRIKHGLPEGEYRPQAVVEAEIEEREAKRRERNAKRS